MAVELEPADIFLTCGTSIVSRAIRLVTRRFGEGRTQVNHVGIIVEGAPANDAMGVEALSKVVRRRLGAYAGTSTKVAVYRPTNLTAEQIATIVGASEAYVGRSYGYLKIVTHGLDWLLQGAYVFRRLTNDDNYPICSWVVAQAYAKAGKDFDVAPGAASPDDIWDFLRGNPDKYREIIPLGRLPA